MDGPAFHIAREGLEELKSYKYSIIQFYGNVRRNRQILNNGLKYIMATLSGWKLNTLQIFTEIYRGEKVKEIAARMAISERAVYKAVRTHRLQELTDFLMSLNLEASLGEER